jgi:oligosaccharide reducing-end xylanase
MIEVAFEQLYFGDAATQAVYREVGADAAYVEDVANGDVRTDSMGYGMLVSVQLARQDVFDRLWTWAKRYMLRTSGERRDMLDWRCTTAGTYCTPAAATDATSVIATSLFMAAARWPENGGSDYVADANMLIDAMVLTEQRNGGIVAGTGNLFDVERALPRAGSFDTSTVVHTDYVMPAFYDYWSTWRATDGALWSRAAERGRELLRASANPTTGLLPNAVNDDGSPVIGLEHYNAAASRALLNLALDNVWFGPRSWIAEQSERRLDFFLREGPESYVAEYTLSGLKLVDYNTPAHRALVALAAASSDNPNHDVFLQALLGEPVPEGEQRYFDGMLYLLSLIVLSGNFEADVP